jgi:hypothetical protein
MNDQQQARAMILTCSERSTKACRHWRLDQTDMWYKPWPGILHSLRRLSMPLCTPKQHANAKTGKGDRWPSVGNKSSELIHHQESQQPPLGFDAFAFLYHKSTFVNPTQPHSNTPRHAYCRSHPIQQPSKTRETS